MRSRSHTYSTFSPSPGASVHALVDANGCQAVHDDVLLMHIEATPLASVAASARVTVGTRVHAALLLILTDPVGGSASTVTESAVPCAVPPALVARMLSRRTRPFAAAMPVATQVKLGIAPVTTAGCHVDPPSEVYWQLVTALSLSLKLALRSNGLSTQLP